MSEKRRDEGALSMKGVEAAEPPLCVDLDGTLVVTDTLWEALLGLIRRQPWLALLLPFWVLAGRAALKKRVSSRLVVDPARLPYREETLALIEEARAAGRRVVLATAADRQVAEAVAAHLGCFDEVIASEGRENLRARGKTRALVERFGRGGFDYVGDSPPDAPVFAAARRAYLIDIAAKTRRRLEAAGVEVVVLVPRRSLFLPLVRQIRPHQWAKNGLLFLPLALAEDPPGLALWAVGALAFLSFSLLASAGYVLNDLADLEADRAHKTKRRRPLASGELPVRLGPGLFGALLLGSVAVAATFLGPAFLVMLAIYFVATVSYSFHFKSKMLVDVLILAGLYTHRILSGGVATGIEISAWLLAFSMFLFMSLAFAKRYVELLDVVERRSLVVKARGYVADDLDMVASMGPAAGFLSVLVFTLYINDDKVQQAYAEPRLLWLVSPILLYWIARIWFLARRRLLNDDPVRFAIKDPRSLICGALVLVIVELAKHLEKLDFVRFVR